MTAEISVFPDTREASFDALAEALECRGYLELPGELPPLLAQGLLRRVIDLDDEEFRAAGIGRASDFQRNRFVRNDEIRWFSGEDPVERAYLQWMESLRVAMNRRLFLGLFDYECHFARYTLGAFYKKHLDAFKGRTNRVLSTVTYLNPGWMAADGGQLLIYGDDGEREDVVVATVQPLMGTVVVFLSDSVPHEVLAAQRLRYSIAGWFRVNTSLGDCIDPPA